MLAQRTEKRENDRVRSGDAKMPAPSLVPSTFLSAIFVSIIDDGFGVGGDRHVDICGKYSC